MDIKADSGKAKRCNWIYTSLNMLMFTKEICELRYFLRKLGFNLLMKNTLRTRGSI